MIIDRIFDGFAGYGDRGVDVMMSPANGSPFYSCTSPGTEPGQTSPWRPSSAEREDSWYNTGSPPYPHPDPSFTFIPVESPQISLTYQGVRVKKTVKEMIMQKRTSKVQTCQHKNEIEFPVSDLRRLLQGKRTAAEMISPEPLSKRPACDHVMMQEQIQYSPITPKEPSISMGFGDLYSNTELSIDSVTVQENANTMPHLSQEVLNPYPTPPTPFYPGSPYSPPMQIPSPQQEFGPSGTPVPVVSFFQWQIQQEEEKLASLSPQDLTSRDGDGDTFLHIAVAQGRRAMAFVLAKKMSHIGMLDIKEHNNQSAFQVSVAANQHLIAQDLLSLGAQVNTTDCWGRTPLHVCAEKGHTLILQAIQKHMQDPLGQNVNLEAVDYDGLTPLHVAVQTHNAVVQELSQLAAPQSPQSAALMQRRKMLGECINTLLLMGASYGTMDQKSGRTSLHMAAEEANVELLRLFLDQSDSLSVVNMKAYTGNTALHMAAAQNGRQAQVHAIQLLMRRGADPSAKNLENEQPIQLAPEGPIGDQVRRILKGRSPQVRSYPQL